MKKYSPIFPLGSFDDFFKSQIRAGRYSSTSELGWATEHLFEHEQSNKDKLINELKKGEESGFVQDIDRKIFLHKLHEKYTNNRDATH